MLFLFYYFYLLFLLTKMINRLYERYFTGKYAEICMYYSEYFTNKFILREIK